MTAAGAKIGIIAGGGEAPLRVAEACAAAGRPYYVARIEGLCDPRLEAHPGGSFPLGAMGARFKALKAAGCDAVAMIGIVRRPDFGKLQLDARAALMLPKVLAAAGKGDDALLRVLVEECEREGFRVVGAESIARDLAPAAGPFGTRTPDAAGQADIAKGAALAAALGAWDVAQGVVVCAGLVLAVEAAEGTDAMLARVAGLPAAVRGSPQARRGVLVKRAKPGQDRRVDLPTIGLATIEAAGAAGLAGVAVEAGASLVVDRAAVAARADALGLFVIALDFEASA